MVACSAVDKKDKLWALCADKHDKAPEAPQFLVSSIVPPAGRRGDAHSLAVRGMIYVERHPIFG